jgi:hypothetical protein
MKASEKIKRIGLFVFGLILTLLLASTMLYLLKLLKLKSVFAVGTLIALIALQILCSYLLVWFLKNRFVKYGIFFGSIFPLVFFAIGLWMQIDFTPPKQISSEKPSSQQEVSKNLNERINQSNLGILSDTLAISVTSLSEKWSDRNVTSVNSLLVDFSPFKIQSSREWRETNSKSRFEIVHDTLFILHLSESRQVTQRLKIPDGPDSISYVGYLPLHKMFVFVENVGEFGPDYFSIDARTGQRLYGVPLYDNVKNNLFGNAYFRHDIGDVEVVFQLWKKSNDNFCPLLHKAILINKTLEENNFEIRNIHWKDYDFLFDLRIDNDTASIKARVLKM